MLGLDCPLEAGKARGKVVMKGWSCPGFVDTYPSDDDPGTSPRDKVTSKPDRFSRRERTRTDDSARTDHVVGDGTGARPGDLDVLS